MPTDAQSLIHWSDNDLAVIDKPSGLRSTPDGYDTTLPHVWTELEPHLGRLLIVHRLDRDTTRLMVLARNADFHRNLNSQFDSGTVQKRYHAIIEGYPDWQSKSINLPLRIDGDRGHRTVVDTKQGKVARTDIRLLMQGHERALIEAKPYTGRTHQIRAHMAAIGHPIHSDQAYGSRHIAMSANRMVLHACHLSFSHPKTKDLVTFDLAGPDEFEVALQFRIT